MIQLAKADHRKTRYEQEQITRVKDEKSGISTQVAQPIAQPEDQFLLEIMTFNAMTNFNPLYKRNASDQKNRLMLR